MQTTDNRLALRHLSDEGWHATLRPGYSGGPASLLVETMPGEEWKVAQALAAQGIYPSVMRQATMAAPSGTLEQRYLAAVGRIESPSSEETS